MLSHHVNDLQLQRELIDIEDHMDICPPPMDNSNNSIVSGLASKGDFRNIVIAEAVRRGK